MKNGEPKSISVFIASPGDLAPERKIFKETIDELNAGFADGIGVRFIPLGWEDLPAETGRRTQAVINRQIEQCDLFVLALHRRWGQKAPDSKFSSYTEEEFQLAFSLWRKRKAPEVVVFFKTVDAASLADQGKQLKKVLAFRKSLEEGHAIIIRPFNADVDFGKEIDRHLRAFARGEWKALDVRSPQIQFPKAQVKALTKAEHTGELRVARAQKQKRSATAGAKGKKGTVAAKADLSLVMSHQTELAYARAAFDAASNGRIQDARILFAEATEGTTDLSILSMAAEFFRQTGDPDNSSRLVQRQAAIARDRRIAAEHYSALVPEGFESAILNQTLTSMLSQFPEELADELRSICVEVWSDDNLKRFTIEMMVKHYTEAEIVQLARFRASPVGQSSLWKQQAILAETIAWANREFQRVLLNRYPEMADTIGQLQAASAGALPADGTLNQLAAGPAQSPVKTDESN